MYTGQWWSWSYGSWIYNYLCNQCLSPLKLWLRIPFMWGVLDTTLCDKVCQWLVVGRWFSPGTPLSSTNKTTRHDISEVLLKVVLNTISLNIKHVNLLRKQVVRTSPPHTLSILKDTMCISTHIGSHYRNCFLGL